MKNYPIISLVFVVFTSCASTRSTTLHNHPSRTSAAEPRFLESISIRPLAAAEPKVKKPARITPAGRMPGLASGDIESCDELQFKYAILMEEPVESVNNQRLFGFLEEWYGAPYRYGGESRHGIDCSAFTCKLMDSVYDITLPRTARSQFTAGRKIVKDDLVQGDLVFFNTTGGVSHVGVYLGNNKFVHASTSGGVMISDLDDYYFRRRYVGSARVK